MARVLDPDTIHQLISPNSNKRAGGGNNRAWVLDPDTIHQLISPNSNKMAWGGGNNRAWVLDPDTIHQLISPNSNKRIGEIDRVSTMRKIGDQYCKSSNIPHKCIKK